MAGAVAWQRIGLALVLLAAVVAGAIRLHPVHLFREAFLAPTAYRADRLFGRTDPNYDPAIHRLAQRIEWGDKTTPADFEGMGKRINERHGDGTTLLFQAVGSGNVSAVDALLAAGADPYMTDKPTGSGRNFVYYLTMPGGPRMDLAGINAMLAAYLKHGGDPNGTWGNKAVSEGNLPEGLALVGNIDGLTMDLKAGGNPWLPTYSNGQPDGNAMDTLATSDMQFAALDRLIDAGYFDKVPQARLHDFLVSLGGHAQRGDEISLNIQRIAKRVLKRNPDYVETSTIDQATRRIFKSHWQDKAPGVIPWDEIKSDAVN